ncbi:MAG: hypothetical protein R2724_29260 [Bryobacterales bacterium]
MPGAPGGRRFNSYNQPSVNRDGLVVIRARSRGGDPFGAATHGIYLRDMSVAGPVVRILDRTTVVPGPNNLGSSFIETPSFPRIDIDSQTIVTRGNHPPVWEYIEGGLETRAGTTGVYANPFGSLITGAAKLGDLPDFSFWETPEFPGVRFEVFPGAPSATRRSTIAFKGNYTAGGVAMTGVYFRDLEAGPIALLGGSAPIVGIASSADTLIPGSRALFGSTAPPSAAGDTLVFAGFDNEDAPTLGGIYLAPLRSKPPLTPLVSIGSAVPEEKNQTFAAFGEGLSFDGRHVGFWGAWGNKTRTVRLYCPTEGNQDRIAYCNQELVCADTGQVLGDPNSVCNDPTDPNYGIACYQEKHVPVGQGVFVHDVKTRRTQVVAKVSDGFDDFLFWNYSGKTPCVGAGHSEEGAEDDGEAVRWRSSAFVAVSSTGASFRAAFKARKGQLVNGVWKNSVDGIYLDRGPGWPRLLTVVDTTMAGQVLDPESAGEFDGYRARFEREGLRGDWLVINATMGVEGEAEEEGMAGVYITPTP